MNIYKTDVSFSDDLNGNIYSADTIEYKDKFWIVPTWNEELGGTRKKPERIVCLDFLKHQKSDFAPFQFVLNDPIPKSLFYGAASSQTIASGLIIMNPEIWVSIRP